MTSPKDSPNMLPKYVQISELIIRDIGAGRLLTGERLPPERAMADSLNTSVGTLRKALAILVKKGLLESVHGSGNYVRHKGKIDSVYSMFRLELHEGGGLPRADILDVTPLPKPDDLLDFGSSDHATRIRRLRYLNDTVIAIEEIWLDGDAGEVRTSELSDSLYHYYQNQLGFWITRAEDRVGLGNVPDWAPATFGLPIGEKIGFIERLSWASSSKAVEFSRTWFDTDRALYVQRIK